jgi:uncharacterized protein YggE
MNLKQSLRSLPTLLIQAALVTAVSTLALVLITRYVAPIPLSINQITTNKDSAFLASGKSVVTTTPDQVEVTVGISLKENDIKQAQSKANDIINNITKSLTDLGVSKDDIKTQNYSIYPNYDYQKSGQNIIGYSVDISLSIKLTDFDKVNKAIDLATAAGANQVSGIQFTLSDKKEREVKAQARAQAIEDAKGNAQQLASLAGMKLGRVINAHFIPNSSKRKTETNQSTEK